MRPLRAILLCLVAVNLITTVYGAACDSGVKYSYVGMTKNSKYCIYRLPVCKGICTSSIKFEPFLSSSSNNASHKCSTNKIQCCRASNWAIPTQATFDSNQNHYGQVPIYCITQTHPYPAYLTDDTALATSYKLSLYKAPLSCLCNDCDSNLIGTLPQNTCHRLHWSA